MAYPVIRTVPTAIFCDLGVSEDNNAMSGRLIFSVWRE